jgi:hypothetical protein
MYCILANHDVYTSALSAVATATAAIAWHLFIYHVVEHVELIVWKSHARRGLAQMPVTHSRFLQFYLQWPFLSKDK